MICHYNKYQEFNSDCLSHFSKLKNLYIGQSLFQTFLTKIPKLDHLEVSFELFCRAAKLKRISFQFINISRTQLSTIKYDFFYDLPALITADLRHNQLTTIERFVLQSTNVKMYLFDNKWNCTHNLKWVATNDYRFDILDRDKLNCSDPKYRARPLILVMQIKLYLSKSCHEGIPELRNCSCHLSWLRLDEVRNI